MGRGGASTSEPKVKYCPSHNNGDGARVPITEFYRSKQTKSGLAGMCKTCARQSRRASYDRNGNTERTQYANFRTAARRRGLRVQLSFEQFAAIRTEPCVYGGGHPPEIRIGLDRKENDIGYTPKNSVPCCARHNGIKSDVFSHAEMLRLVCEFPSAAGCGNARGGRKKLARIWSPKARAHMLAVAAARPSRNSANSIGQSTSEQSRGNRRLSPDST
jgi:hypothetical protein